jgi:hypothetical protein
LLAQLRINYHDLNQILTHSWSTIPASAKKTGISYARIAERGMIEPRGKMPHPTLAFELLLFGEVPRKIDLRHRKDDTLVVLACMVTPTLGEVTGIEELSPTSKSVKFDI